MKEMKRCLLCDKKHFAKGLCYYHYYNSKEYKLKKTTYRNLPKNILRRRELQNTPSFKLKRKEYNSRPLVKKRQHELYLKRKQSLTFLINKKKYNIKYSNRPDVILKRKLRYQQKHAIIRVKDNAYRKRIDIKIRRQEQYKQKMTIDVLFALKNRIRLNLIANLKKQHIVKSKLTSELLGYSIQDLKTHLEKQFDDKMSWNNFGQYWHIDHKIPISFANNEREFIELYQLDNLQPLEAKANIKKSNKVIANLFNIREIKTCLK